MNKEDRKDAIIADLKGQMKRMQEEIDYLRRYRDERQSKDDELTRDLKRFIVNALES